MPDGGKEDKYGKHCGGKRRHEESVACKEPESREKLLFHFPHHEYADAEKRERLVWNSVAREKGSRLGEDLPDYAERRGYVACAEEYPGEEYEGECDGPSYKSRQSAVAARNAPWIAPQMTNVQFAPCHIPLSRNVTNRLYAWRSALHLLPPSGM